MMVHTKRCKDVEPNSTPRTLHLHPHTWLDSTVRMAIVITDHPSPPLLFFIFSEGVKCELEALYTLGDGSLGHFLESVMTSGEYI